MSRNPSKNWVFTLNNPADHLDPKPDGSNAGDPTTWFPHCRYLVFQLEKGENNTPHYQGYLVLKDAQRLSFLKKISPAAHWEIRAGSHQQAKDYCTKAEGRLREPVEMGEEPRLPGRKESDDRFRHIITLIKDGANDKQLLEEDPQTFVKHFPGLQRARITIAKVSRNWRTRCIVLWGPTGTGKSRFLADLNQRFPGEVYWKPKDEASSNWWDGLEPDHKYVVIDEFYGDKPFYFMTKLLDSNPLLVPIKTSFVDVHPCTVIITSNDDPANWYKNLPPGRKAVLFRRLTVIAKKESLNSPPIITQALDDFERPLDPTIDPIFYALHLTEPRLPNGYPPPLTDPRTSYYNYFDALPADNIWKPTSSVTVRQMTPPTTQSSSLEVPTTPVLNCSSSLSSGIYIILSKPFHNH